MFGRTTFGSEGTGSINQLPAKTSDYTDIMLYDCTYNIMEQSHTLDH